MSSSYFVSSIDGTINDELLREYDMFGLVIPQAETKIRKWHESGLRKFLPLLLKKTRERLESEGALHLLDSFSEWNDASKSQLDAVHQYINVNLVIQEEEDAIFLFREELNNALLARKVIRDGLEEYGISLW